LDLNLKVIQPLGSIKWFTGDYKIHFHKTTGGWYAYPNGDDIKEAMRVSGLSWPGSALGVCFPSLKEARKTVAYCAEEAGITLDERLTRKGHIKYQIGSLPLYLQRESSNWLIKAEVIETLPTSLKSFFPGGIDDFIAECTQDGLIGKSFHTRNQALGAVKQFLQKL
jgi:hypothetical protein